MTAFSICFREPGALWISGASPVKQSIGEEKMHLQSIFLASLLASGLANLISTSLSQKLWSISVKSPKQDCLCEIWDFMQVLSQAPRTITAKSWIFVLVKAQWIRPFRRKRKAAPELFPPWRFHERIVFVPRVHLQCKRFLWFLQLKASTETAGQSLNNSAGCVKIRSFILQLLHVF